MTDSKTSELERAKVIPDAEAALVDGEPVMPQGQHVMVRREFAFPGDVQSVAESREQVMQCVREYCQGEAEEIDLTLALQEALANAALHGCGNDAGQTIHCVIEIGPGQISCVVRDPGHGFNFARVADPAGFHATTLEHGRGIALMRAMVDELSFAGGGSEVRFRKRMNCHAASPTG